MPLLGFPFCRFFSEPKDETRDFSDFPTCQMREREILIMSALFPSPSPCRRPRRPSGPRRPCPFLLPFAGRVPCASVPCRTSTAILCCQCSLPDLNRDPLLPVFPCRTSTGRKNVRRDARTFARKNVRQIVREMSDRTTGDMRERMLDC